MTLDQFTRSLAESKLPPSGISIAAQALWWAGTGGWSQAHDLAASDNGREGAWVHAYLHRQEGDLGNAGYWYRRAGKPIPTDTLGVEWSSIAAALLETA